MDQVNGEVDSGIEPIPSTVCEEVIELKRIWHEVMSKDKVERYDFRRVNRYRLIEETRKVNELVGFIETSDITETNCLIRAVSVNVAKRLGLCESLEDNRAKRGRKPWWHRRLENDIKVLRSNISVLESKRAGKLKKFSKYKMLEKKYSIKKKGFQVVLEELKQRLVAKSGKVRRYEQRIKQYTQNRLFNSNQKRFYQQLDGRLEKEVVVPDAKQSVSFWKGIWGTISFKMLHG